MDFNDTPEEAAFRKEVRTWLEANATRKSDDKQSFRARNDDARACIGKTQLRQTQGKDNVVVPDGIGVAEQDSGKRDSIGIVDDQRHAGRPGHGSQSVSTFPEGFVGRDTQIAATSSSTVSRSKSTWYLNRCPGRNSRRGSTARRSPGLNPWFM